MVAIFQKFLPLIGPFELDATILEEHSIEFEISSNPLEDQTMFQDAIIEKPRVLTLVGAISRHPATIIPNVNPIRHKLAWQQFITLAKSKIPFTVVTSLAVYPNMAVRKMTLPRSREGTNVSVITFELQQVFTSVADAAANAVPPAVDIASGTENLGDQLMVAAVAPTLAPSPPTSPTQAVAA